jgi:hypothetical protein
MMARTYYFVFAFILSNLFTYHLVSKSGSNIPHKENFNEVNAIPKPQSTDKQPKYLKVAQTNLGASEYSRNDLQYAGDAILGLEPSSIRTSLLHVLTAGWFELDHIGLAEWLNQQPEEVDIDQAVVVFSRLAGQVDPETSLGWAASISDRYLQERTVCEVAKQFRSNYSEQFYEYMANGGSGPRLIASTGFATIPGPATAIPHEEAVVRMDIIEEESESNESILARRVRLAGTSSRVNNVELIQD